MFLPRSSFSVPENGGWRAQVDVALALGETALQMLQNEILEMIARGGPLDATARALCRRVEALLPGSACSIVQLDMTGQLKALAGPSLPDAFNHAFDGLAIGPRVAACGSAVYLAQVVETPDIATDPRWSALAAQALEHGLRACWSAPVVGGDGVVLGAFSVYYREPRLRTEAEAELAQGSIHLCAIAMEGDRRTGDLRRLIYRDLLTDLPNRAAFEAVAARLTDDTRPGAVLIVDLDNLKTVNDAFGQKAGDCLLQATAKRVEEAAAPFRVFRLGGDEFAVVIDDAEIDAAELDILAGRVLAGLSEPVDCNGNLTTPLATLGGALADAEATLGDLRKKAEFALCHAKTARLGGFAIYSPALDHTVSRRLCAIRTVEAALNEDRVDAHYQPIVRIDTGEIVGLEALFRVITPEGEIVSAGDCFEATLDVHTATRLTGRMLAIVSHDVRTWLDQGIWFQHVGINASSADLQSGRFHEALAEAFERENVPLSHVILEVTESVYMGREGHEVRGAIQDLRARGLRIALDDFGTGFASLTHLLSMPVDILKIDKSFIAPMEPGSRGAAITEGVLAIASRLGIRVVAEGVETAAQAEQLRKWGCFLGQGYFYSPAVDRTAVTRLLLEKAQARDSVALSAAIAAPVADLRAFDLHEASVVHPGDDIRETLVRYAILLCGADWRVVSERRQFGRFSSRSAALQCALGLAREAMASGASVEILHADLGGELRAFHLPRSWRSAA